MQFFRCGVPRGKYASCRPLNAAPIRIQAACQISRQQIIVARFVTVARNRQKTWRAPAGGFRRAPLVSRQSAYKPGSGWHADNTRMRDGHSSATPVARRLKQPTRTAGSGHRSRNFAPWRVQASRRPYSVLLPVGFTVPPALPPARCALTAPFHPCRGNHATRRGGLLFCGTIPRLAPAGRYPAPLVHGARTFLSVNLSVSTERPSGRLTATGMVMSGSAVKRRRGRRNRGRARRCCELGRDAPANRAACCGSRDRRRRRSTPGGSDAGTPRPRRASPNRSRCSQ
jgi:hypothetical protein